MDFRQFHILESFLALAASVVLAGCGGGQDKTSTPSTAPESTQPSRDKEIVLYSWEEYFAPEVLAEFEKETGIKVTLETFEDTDEVESQVRATPGKHDVIVFDTDMVQVFGQLKLISELDHSKLPNYSNIAEAFRDLSWDPKNKFSMPYLTGTTLVAYRNDKIPTPEKSWNILWDPQYRGKVAMIDERKDVFAIALKRQGDSINATNPTKLEAAGRSLVDQVQDMEVKYVDGIPSALGEALASGETWIAVGYSGDAAAVAQDNANVSSFIPDEGASMWIDNFVISRESRHQEEAHLLINFMLSKEAAAKSANYLCYASPNKAAVSLLDKQLTQNPSINPPAEVLAKCEFIAIPTPDRERIINATWKETAKALASHSPKANSEAITSISPEEE